jgi:hypothetical protein
MTSLIPESIFTWVNLVGTLVPPRDPNDDDDEEEEEDDDHEADEDREPAVIREPDLMKDGSEEQEVKLCQNEAPVY